MQSNSGANLKSGVVELTGETLSKVSGGIWDYSNRLGALGQMLEDRKDRNYGDPLHPKNIDAAAHQALEGWISIP